MRYLRPAGMRSAGNCVRIVLTRFLLKYESACAKEHPRSILLIDDDVALCTLIAEFLSAQEFHVDTVHTGPRGLASAIEGAYDLVLLDVMLPVLDGFHVLQRLRQRTMVPVIMLTARNDESDRIAGLDAGADDYIAKPLRPHELLAQSAGRLAANCQAARGDGVRDRRWRHRVEAAHSRGLDGWGPDRDDVFRI